MRAPQHIRISRPFRGPLACGLLGIVCLFGLVGCGEDTIKTTEAGDMATEPATPPKSATTVAIELSDKGFSPDRTEVSEGTIVTLRNATDSEQSIVVKGRDLGGSDGDRLTLEPGQTVGLNVRQLGAYILTLADDPQVTASIFIT